MRSTDVRSAAKEQFILFTKSVTILARWLEFKLLPLQMAPVKSRVV
jgi:hypothetical protein